MLWIKEVEVVESVDDLRSEQNHSDLCTVVPRNDDIQEFDSKWDEILLSKTKIPSDEILESLYN